MQFDFVLKILRHSEFLSRLKLLPLTCSTFVLEYRPEHYKLVRQRPPITGEPEVSGDDTVQRQSRRAHLELEVSGDDTAQVENLILGLFLRRFV
jgi:hypothetical protein